MLPFDPEPSHTLSQLRMTVRRSLCWFALLLLVAGAAYVHFDTYEPVSDWTKRDIYHDWNHGRMILQGENPYDRINSGNMRVNEKYPIYFPLFYWFSAASQWAGLSGFQEWLSFWRIVFFLVHAALAGLFYWLYDRRGLAYAGLLVAAVWLFNRWTLYVAKDPHIDVLAVGLLVGAVLCWEFRKLVAASVLFGLSLAIKQIGIFLLPLYLLKLYRDQSDEKAGRSVLFHGSVIGGIVLLASLPFLLRDTVDFTRTILFSTTRYPNVHGKAWSVDYYLKWIGVTGRLPMLGTMLFAYGVSFYRNFRLRTDAFLLMLIFVSFQTAFFTQHMAWFIAFVPLVLLDVLAETEPETVKPRHG